MNRIVKLFIIFNLFRMNKKSYSNVELKDIQIRVGKINALLNPLTFIVTNIAIITVLYLFGVDYKFNNLQQGDVSALYNYLLQILRHNSNFH